jgi:hypothetical protein
VLPVVTTEDVEDLERVVLPELEVPDVLDVPGEVVVEPELEIAGVVDEGPYVADQDSIVPSVNGLDTETVPSVPGLVVTTVVTAVVPGEVCELSLVSGLHDETVLADVLVEAAGGGVSTHRRMLLTRSVLFLQPPRYVRMGTLVLPGAMNMDQKGPTDVV